MKTYSIGRDLGCDIVINDTTDVVSLQSSRRDFACRGSELSLPRVATYGYGKLRLSDAAWCGYLFLISVRFVSFFRRRDCQ